MNKLKRKFNISLILAIIGIVFLILGNSKKETTIEQTKFFMDTVVTIKATGKNPQRAITLAYERMESIAAKVDRFDLNSEISNINAQAGNGLLLLSDDLFNIIEDSLNWGNSLEGAFSIALAPLMDTWGFSDADKQRVPKEEEIEELLAIISLANIEIFPQEKAITMKKGTILDLGGSAKGYVVQEGMKVLVDNGISSAYINAGGDIMVEGLKPDNSKWTIGIRDPRIEDGKDYLKDYILNLDSGCVITSGDYERYFVVNNIKYHHILDPRTGYPANGLRSATIVGPSALIGDILATALMVLGRGGLSILEDIDGYEALLISNEGTIIVTSGLEKHISR